MTRLSVVVPTHDEEELIEACVSSLLRSREHLAVVAPDVACAVVVVLDACTDDTGDRLRRFVAEVDVVEVSRRSVGAARRAGAERALALAGPDDHWLAQTDADSVVPEHWLARHLAALTAGVDLLLGTVVPDLSTFDDAQREQWRVTHPAGTAGNTHGANLGISAEAYARIGGYANLPEHEDVDLVRRVRAAGGRVESTPDIPVSTSSRRVGRTPGGYAGFLRTAYPLHAEART